MCHRKSHEKARFFRKYLTYKSELIGAWILNEWTTAGGPDQFEYLELGPGRGTLAKDVIRTIQQLLTKIEKNDVKINVKLLEISARV